MLSRQFRLRHRTDIARIRRDGRRWRHPLLILLACPPSKKMNRPAGGRPTPSRFAIIAGRRVGNAVTRNRAKRLLREAVRTQLPEIETGWDCLLIARPLTPGASFGEVEAAVRNVFLRAGLGKSNASAVVGA